MELGDLARVSLPTTGLKDDPSFSGSPTDETASHHGTAAPAEVKRPERRKLDAVRLDPVYVAPSVASPERGGSGKASVAEAIETEPGKPQRSPFATSSRTTVKLGKPLPQAGKRPEPVPDLITRPMQLPLQAVAAGRAKPVQAFPLNSAFGTDVHVPRSNALPLRPLITIETAPAKASAVVTEPTAGEIKTEPVKVETKAPQVAAGSVPTPSPRPDPRTATSRRRDTRVIEPDLRETGAGPLRPFRRRISSKNLRHRRPRPNRNPPRHRRTRPVRSEPFRPSQRPCRLR